MKENRIAIIGLGYVGLPLAVAFGKKFTTIGYDIDEKRVDELKVGIDRLLEVEKVEINKSVNLSVTSDFREITDCNIYIITVPTPVDSSKKPDLSYLRDSSELVGRAINVNDIIIYESTVYPGATEEFCVPILEKASGLTFNHDFFCGYSPERINPGDKERGVVDVVKVISGSTDKIADKIDEIYSSVILAGTYKASSIKVAEAAKVIENTQRDVNIALVNELSLIFNKLNIDTTEVLKAAGSKWNFLHFKPGLVGGHCIGVDPYYLTHKAIESGYHPEVILAGRKINDGMGTYVADQLIKLMTKNKIQVVNSRILILGVTFKENCPDIRDTRVVEIVEELQEFNSIVDVYDPWASKYEVKDKYNIELIEYIEKNKYQAILIAVAHKEFIEMGIDLIRTYGEKDSIIYDVKSLFDKDKVNGRL